MDASQIHGWLVSGLQTCLQGLVAVSGAFVVGTLNALVGLAITLFVLFFFLRDGDRMMATAVRLIPMRPDAPGASSSSTSPRSPGRWCSARCSPRSSRGCWWASGSRWWACRRRWCSARWPRSPR